MDASTSSAVSTKSLIAASTATTAAAGGAVTTSIISTQKTDKEISQSTLNKDKFIYDRKKQEEKYLKKKIENGIGDCKTDYFENLNFNQEPSNYAHPSGTYKPFSPNNYGAAIGCLKVSWKKRTTTETIEDKNGWWIGEINWEWVLQIEKEAFLFIGEGKNGSENTGKIDVNYKLIGLNLESKKVNKDNKEYFLDEWKIKYYKNSQIKNIASNEHKEKFPQGFKNEDESKRSWGFVPWFDKSCKLNHKDETNCTFGFDNLTEKIEKRWSWMETTNRDEKDKFKDLHCNFDALWNNYKQEVDLEGRHEKTGIWVE